MKLSQKSQLIIDKIHPSLKRVVEEAAKISRIDFIVTEGLRTIERQKELVDAGASWTMNSRHLTGHAVDLAVLVGGEVRWDWPLYYKLADTMLGVAAGLRIPLVWGGSWVRHKDGPHFELNRSFYP